MTNQFFKIKPGTDYEKAIQKSFTLQPLWREVYSKVSELLDEEITLLVQDPQYLQIEYGQLKKEENKRIFKKLGTLKGKSKRANEVSEAYSKIIEELGLQEYKNIGLINFSYGVMRFHGETMSTFKTSDNEVYYKTNFDLEERSKGLVISISEIEYQETYLSELKKQESA